MQQIQGGLRIHAQIRAERRLGFIPDFPTLVKKVQCGKAEFVCFGFQSRLIYDVPWTKDDGSEIKIRVVMNPEKNFVISVLPSELRAKQEQLARKRINKTRRAFEDDEEIPVTELGSQWRTP